MRASPLHRLPGVTAVAVLSLAFPSAVSPVQAQTPAQPVAPPVARATFDWSIATIMRGPEHFGREPQNVAFTHDGQWIYFQWAPAGAAWNAPLRPYRVRATAGGVPEAVTEAHMDSASVRLATGPRTRDGKLMAVASRGDLYLVTVRTGALRRLTETTANENDARFSADERHVLFTREKRMRSTSPRGR